MAYYACCVFYTSSLPHSVPSCSGQNACWVFASSAHSSACALPSQVCQVNTLLTLLNGHLKAVKDSGKAVDEQKMERVFLFCLVWALGGLLDMKERPLFDHELRT